MKIIYIAHCIGGEVDENLKDLRRILRKLNLTEPDIVPFCPYYADLVCLDDSVPEERVRGIMNDTALLQRGFIDEIWLTGPVLSSGMKAEVEIGRSVEIPVIDKIGQL